MSEKFCPECNEVDDRPEWERMKLEFAPMVRQLGATLKAEIVSGLPMHFGVDIAEMLDKEFERRARAFYYAAYREGYERGRNDEERVWEERWAKHNA